MSKPGLSYGLNLKKATNGKPAPPKRKPIFGGDDDSDDDGANSNGPQATKITELDDDDFSSKPSASNKKGSKILSKPTLKKKPQPNSMFGDLSSSLESRKHQEAAEELDPSIYDYDGVYDSLKPEKVVAPEDVDRRPKYMKSLLQSAAVRKRDALIAEEKKVAREREEEGEEYADKEKFVTEAYKKQQEENRRIEAEERVKEEEEAKKNKGGGMTAFYKDLLNRGDQRHAEVMKAAEDKAKLGPQAAEDQSKDQEKAKTEADMARELNSKGGSVAINDDGQVVDKRELLKGGLNLGTVKKPEVRRDQREPERRQDRASSGFVGAGGKQSMRERQSRMMEAQLEESLKRSREHEAEEREKVERAAKSRKTEGEISSAKERYLARKAAAAAAAKET
ncbi:coiled-coil domain-containing protein 55-domain containing protein [Apiospora marii]|uniref:Coiled-coil domain-containing protein 55-domain containing protein n=1 Tax=Apiospora marii TaxID=335849 RepID=A0ABR1SNS7_9PEZI